MEKDLSISWNTKLKYSLPLCGFFIISYIIPNRFQFLEPKALPMLLIDKIMPIVPWTIFIYLSEWFIYLIVLSFIFDKLTFRRLLLSFMLTFLISMCVFFLYPTIITDRPNVDGVGITYLLFKLLHFIDNPVNCFPSQHVAIVTIPPIIFWKYNKKLSLLFWIWAILVSISTLTTKQHYFVDILGGMILAWVSVALADKIDNDGSKDKLPILFQKLLPR